MPSGYFKLRIGGEGLYIGHRMERRAGTTKSGFQWKPLVSPPRNNVKRTYNGTHEKFFQTN